MLVGSGLIEPFEDDSRFSMRFFMSSGVWVVSVKA